MEKLDLLATLADNKNLFDEVHAFVLSKFDVDGRSDEAISDERLGQMYRARLVGVSKVNEAFREIAARRTRKEAAFGGKNPAR